MKFLVDSDYVVDYLKGRKEAVETLSTLGRENLTTSVITVAEILEGIYGQDQEETLRQSFEDFLSALVILPLERKEAAEFAKVRATLRREGKLIDNFDILIAATCLANHLTLVTRNRKHFTRIPGLSLYS